MHSGVKGVTTQPKENKFGNNQVCCPLIVAAC